MTSDTMTIHILFRQEIIYNPDTSPRRVASGNVFTTTFPLPLPRQRPPYQYQSVSSSMPWTDLAPTSVATAWSGAAQTDGLSRQ